MQVWFQDAKELMNRYRESALLQREEYDSRMVQIKDVLDNADKAKAKLRKL